MFLAFGGVIAIQDAGGDIDIWSAMITLTVFIALMSLGVWHVFRKRGRIYIWGDWMSEEPPNFSVFNSRILVDTVGDVTDEAQNEAFANTDL